MRYFVTKIEKTHKKLFDYSAYKMGSLRERKNLRHCLFNMIIDENIPPRSIIPRVLIWSWERRGWGGGGGGF